MQPSTGTLPPALSASAAVLAACLLCLAAAACGPTQFSGTLLTSESPAASFELRNQFGETVSMADRRGRVVVLTFLYTACPDICPLTAERLRAAYELLGEAAEDVSMLVVSVDPERDTEEAALAYSKKWGMERRWDYLVGDRDSLSATWRAYYRRAVDDGEKVDRQTWRRTAASPPTSLVANSSMRGCSSLFRAIVAASLEDGGGAVPATRPEGEAGKSGVEGLREAIEERYLVFHSGPVYLIDREGAMRVLFTLPFEAADLAHDVRLLLESD